jgi:hypothetical protein
MHTILESAHAWFFDSSTHSLNGDLVIRLVEGIKGKERQFVGVGETKLGPYFPVQVKAESQCAQVIFTNALAFFIHNESYDTTDIDLKKDAGRFLFKATSSSFRTFVESRTTVGQVHPEPYSEYLLCCEDRVFSVLSAGEPTVSLLQESPNLSIERTNTWSAS